MHYNKHFMTSAYGRRIQMKFRENILRKGSISTCLKKGWLMRALAEGLKHTRNSIRIVNVFYPIKSIKCLHHYLLSGCCCRQSWTRLCRVAEWFLGAGLWGLSAVAVRVRLPVATLSPIPESTPERDTLRAPRSPSG